MPESETRRDSTTTRMRAIADDVLAKASEKASPKKSEFWGWAAAALSTVALIVNKYLDTQALATQAEAEHAWRLALLKQVGDCLERLGVH